MDGSPKNFNFWTVDSNTLVEFAETCYRLWPH